MSIDDTIVPVTSTGRPPVVLQVLPSLVSGGAERGTVELAGALVEAGWISYVASGGGPLEREIARAGATYLRLPLASKNPLVMRRNTVELVRLIRRFGIDIVHARSRAPAWSACARSPRRAIRRQLASPAALAAASCSGPRQRRRVSLCPAVPTRERAARRGGGQQADLRTSVPGRRPDRVSGHRQARLPSCISGQGCRSRFLAAPSWPAATGPVSTAAGGGLAALLSSSILARRVATVSVAPRRGGMRHDRP